MAIEGRTSRLAQLEDLLLWEGRLSRSRVIEAHGLSEVRASEWLREFRDEHEEWVRWDPKAKAYIATDAAFRHAESLQASRRGGGPSGRPQPSAGPLISPTQGHDIVEVLPWEFTIPSPRIFSALRMAIEDRARVRCLYVSMANPKPHDRTIEPHTLVKAGRRWHVRGYCLETKGFRDFVLGRISGLKRLEEASELSIGDDVGWNAPVKVRVVAHPSLTPEQQLAVRAEYFSGTAARVETCRGAMVPYFIQELRAAYDVERQRPPDFQLAVQNPEDCRRWMFPS